MLCKKQVCGGWKGKLILEISSVIDYIWKGNLYKKSCTLRKQHRKNGRFNCANNCRKFLEKDTLKIFRRFFYCLLHIFKFSLRFFKDNDYSWTVRKYALRLWFQFFVSSLSSFMCEFLLCRLNRR